MANFFNKLASLILPATVLVLVPLAIERRLDVRTDSGFIAGILLATAGLAVLAVTASVLFRIGNGTIAPWSPTRTLVVKGLYRYVRNPMITGVLAVLLGESLIVHSSAIFCWFVAFFVINNVYFVLSEEPGMVRRFGEEYVEYRQNVPRWTPRMRPWSPEGGEASGQRQSAAADGSN